MYISVPLLHDYEVKLPNFFFLWRTWTRQNDLIFSFFELRIQQKEKFDNNCQIERDGIKAKKFKAAWIHFLGDGFPVIAGTAIMSTGNRKMKNGNWQNREWDGKLLIGLEFNLGFVLIFHFPITRSRSPFLFPVPRFPFRVFGFPFPVPCSPFPVSRSSFPVPCSLSLFHVLVKSFVVLENLSVPLIIVLFFFCFALPAS